MLWFAQNSLPLWLKWQLDASCLSKRNGCDLLKIHYLCGWNDNKFWLNIQYSWLWFAQNSLPLWLKWQQTELFSCVFSGCDLLKIHYLCGWNDNHQSYNYTWQTVVICSKFITFVVEMTTLTLRKEIPLCCDLLKIHYLCGWNDN